MEPDLVTAQSIKGKVILPKAIFAPTQPEDVFRSLAYEGEPKSLEAMEAGIAPEAKRRQARGRY